MIPMIRISEMYMIASETSTDGPTRAKYFNTFRNHRNLGNVREWDVNYYLEKEWKKEFYGEGQLFFWYKRNKKTESNRYRPIWFSVSEIVELCASNT